MRAGLPDISRYQEGIGSHLRHAANAVERALERRTERVAAFASQIRSLDPNATLARGYAVVQLRDGKQAITSVSQATGKAKLDINVKDGKFPAEVSRQYGF
jgi:exodeoxyribonuclease VII large subunit